MISRDPHLQTGRLSRESLRILATELRSAGRFSKPSHEVEERFQSSSPLMQTPSCPQAEQVAIYLEYSQPIQESLNQKINFKINKIANRKTDTKHMRLFNQTPTNILGVLLIHPITRLYLLSKESCFMRYLLIWSGKRLDIALAFS